MIDLLVIGLVSILGQAALLRELNVAFYGVDLIYSLALGIWLIWTALGAMIGRRNLSPHQNRIHTLFLLLALLIPIDAVFVRSIRTLFSDIPGAYLPFPEQLLTMNLALLPIGLLSGLTFQWAAKAYLARGRTLAHAYAVESAGGLAGGLCATLFLRLGIQNLAITLICSLIALIPILAAYRRRKPQLHAAAGIAAGILIVLVWRAGPIDHAMTAWTHPSLLATRDTPYCRVTVTRQEGQVAVFENDALSFDTEGTEAEEFVHMAALLHPRPARVLILGGGIQGTLREILKHAPVQVDYVELNSDLLDLVAPHLPADLREPLHAAVVRSIVEDPRSFLNRPGSYDLILIGMPEPDSGQTNRYYTAEFFQQCADRLDPAGILAFRLRSAENRWTPQQTARAVSIYRALQIALPQVQVLPGSTNTFTASRLPLLKDPALLIARLENRGIRARFVSAPYIRYAYENPRFAWTARTLAAGKAPLNTDVRPICYQYTLMIWLSKFYPDLAARDPWLPATQIPWHRAAAWVGAGALLTLFVTGMHRPALRRALLVGTAGFMGMILETVLVLQYQARSGILYQDIGLLLMGFMAGLALGALAVERWVFRRTHTMPPWSGPLILAGFAGLSLTTGARIGAVSSGGLAETAGLLLAAGALVSAAFAYASLEGVTDQPSVVAPVYAADLIGGSLGSLAGSLVMIPAVGLDMTATCMAPLALLCGLLFVGKRR